ncbi:MAG: diacylglycerol kinase family protein [Patescibacteria group bacterium]
MYQYVYDAALTDKRHHLALTAIENRLTDLGIQGRIDRLSLFKNVAESIEEGIRRGVTTIVAVGNDDTVKKVMDAVPQFAVTMGVIPIGKPNKIARLLGVPEGVAACDVLSARLTQTLDIGRVNGHHFLAALSIPAGGVTLECEGKYRVTVPRGPVHVCNMTPLETLLDEDAAPIHQADPSDGMLEAVIPARRGIFQSGERGSKTVLNLRRLTIRAERPFTYVVDGRSLSAQRAEVDVLPGRLKVIVGRNRLFRVPT